MAANDHTDARISSGCWHSTHDDEDDDHYNEDDQDKGLFINDVFTLGVSRPRPSPLSSCHLLAPPPPFVSVNGEKN